MNLCSFMARVRRILDQLRNLLFTGYWLTSQRSSVNLSTWQKGQYFRRYAEYSLAIG
jgi:hypothetical protein